MTKISPRPVFKQYSQNQPVLFPTHLDEMISSTHLVRYVNQMVDGMDIRCLLRSYKGGGSSSYHPRMLLKVLLYGYSVKVYTGRRIARALSQDIHFMWLSGMSRPDFRTLNHFRSGRAKQVIELLFSEMVCLLAEAGYIQLEHYFCDGSFFLADGNKYKMTWRKNALRLKAKAEEKCGILLKQIDTLNEEEDLKYGDQEDTETGEGFELNEKMIQEGIARLNEKINKADNKRQRRTAQKLNRELKKESDKIKKYEQQIQIAGNRSGYNHTDKDATAMRMKNSNEAVPSYNIVAGCEDQFITGISVHQNSNDAACFEEHLEKIQTQQPERPGAIITDAVFGTELNYELLEKEGIDNYLKFPAFHREQTRAYKEDPLRKENFKYDSQNDCYTCPIGRILVYKETIKNVNKVGFVSTSKKYTCLDCSGCSFYTACCKAEDGQPKTLSVNDNLDRHKQEARENLHSEKGAKLRKQRSIEIETCFGDIKHNMGFRRFHLRGKEKVRTEIILVAMAHNLRKLQIKAEQKAA